MLRDKEWKWISQSKAIQISIVWVLTGYIQVYKTSNQSTSEALKYLLTWAANFGMPYAIKADSGPSFRLSFEKELEDLGVKIIHS